jgi:hypothetical protein
MIRLNDFIDQSILEIKAGINKFNKENYSMKAYMPDQVTFEVMVNNEGVIGGFNKITFTVSLTRYHPACGKDK